MNRFAMHHKVLAWLVFCLVCGGLAAWSGFQYLEQKKADLEQQSRLPMVERVVAAVSLPAGLTLNETHLATRSFPQIATPADSLAPQEYQRLLGSVLRVEIAAGDMVLPVHTANKQVDAFSMRLATGRRAITMPVDQINSLAGLLRAGDLVDLYVSFDHQRRKITAPLLQGVLVLATDEQTFEMANESSGAYGTVTFDLSPEDGAKLVAARQSGIITAMLRNPHDGLLSTKGVRGDLATLLGVNAVNPTYKNVPIIYGNKSSRQLRALNATPAAPRSALLDVSVQDQLSYQLEETYETAD